GRLVSEAKPASPAELNLRFEESKEMVGWGAQPNLFSRAHEAGFNTGLMGWYHPYCRIIGDDLTVCSFKELNSRPQGKTLPEALLNQIKSLAQTIPFIDTLGIVGEGNLAMFEKSQQRLQEDGLKAYFNMLAEAKELTTNNQLNLVFIHWPVPHSPVIYNRFKNDFQLDKKNSYIDNLALVDRTIGEIRRAMEAAGVWQDTILLITSDHPLKKRVWLSYLGDYSKEDADLINDKGDARIPFVLKLANQKEAITYDSAFNTILTQDLLLALLKGEISDPASVTGWLENKRAIAESPYNYNKKK
ncbi:MAG: sulfatase-like hydrolase/transferase, partial [Acidobacteriota bacterium]